MKNATAKKKMSTGTTPAGVPPLPELEHAKNAVLTSLESLQSRRSYEHAMSEFVGWYCSAVRLAFNRTVVLQYRTFLEKKHLAAATINVRLAAVRRLAYEAADSRNPQSGRGGGHPARQRRPADWSESGELVELEAG